MQAPWRWVGSGHCRFANDSLPKDTLEFAESRKIFKANRLNLLKKMRVER